MTYRPPKLRTLFAALAALALLATSCGGSSSDVATTTTDAAPAQAAPADQSAEPAPAEASLVATTVSGSQIDFGSLEGQDVVLWFWAPW